VCSLRSSVLALRESAEMKGCIGGENAAHEFDEMGGALNDANQKRLGRTDVVGWAWCKRCGAVLEVLAGAAEPARITLPNYLNEKQETGG
jgi:hypothetical protein